MHMITFARTGLCAAAALVLVCGCDTIKRAREAQAENERVMTEVRRKWHEMIKEVKTVDNPLAPGEKIERPMYFDHSLINSAQNTMVLSDSSLDPHEVEKLVGQGFWTAVD